MDNTAMKGNRYKVNYWSSAAMFTLIANRYMWLEPHFKI